jgi:hypothetical protein
MLILSTMNKQQFLSKPKYKGLSNAEKERRWKQHLLSERTTPRSTSAQNTITVRSRQPRLNPYLVTLCCPEMPTDCKVPDMNCTPSGTYRVCQEFIKSTIADTAQPTVGKVGIYFLPRRMRFYQTTASNSSVLTWDGGTTLDAYTPALSIYKQQRVVSACIMVEYIGSTQNDQGIIYTWREPRTDESAAPPANVTTLINNAQSFSTPLRNGAKVLWAPIDSVDTEYYRPDLAYANGAMGIGVFVDASATGAGIKVTLCANYEALPASDSQSVANISPSESKPGWMVEAANWAGDLADKMTPIYKQVGGQLSNQLNQYASAAVVSALAKIPQRYAASFAVRGIGY